MNALFVILFLASTAILLFVSPENFLMAMLDGASKSATLSFSLIATYAVWLGLMNVWEDSGVSRGVSRLLRPLAKKLFKTDDEQALDAVCMNLSVNLLGISGAATPYGVKAAQLLDKTKNAEYSSAMLFVLNATSIQLIPTSVVGIRASMHSLSPANIILPTVITTAFSTLLGIALTMLFFRKKTRKSVSFFPATKQKTRGAGIR